MYDASIDLEKYSRKLYSNFVCSPCGRLVFAAEIYLMHDFWFKLFCKINRCTFTVPFRDITV